MRRNWKGEGEGDLGGRGVYMAYTGYVLLCTCPVHRKYEEEIISKGLGAAWLWLCEGSDLSILRRLFSMGTGRYFAMGNLHLLDIYARSTDR